MNYLSCESQGHVEAYGSYAEIQARGVELMEFIKPVDEEDNPEIILIDETDSEVEKEFSTEKL